MTKRFTAIFFIVLGIVAFLCVGFFLVLILAPGTRLFGLMYVANDARAYNSKRIYLDKALEDAGLTGFTGSITVEASEIPIYVEYTESYEYEFHYYENYIGLTKTNIEKPKFDISLDKKGGAVIKVKGFEKFIFENKASERFFKLYIPIARIDTEAKGIYDLTIKSEKSDISFYKTLGKTEIRDAYFNKVSIETAGNISYDGLTIAKTYELKTPNSIIVNDMYSTVAKATNYKLTSEKGKITINSEVAGDLDLTTKNGDIKLVSCKNLTANTEHGDIGSAVKGKKVNIAGMVYIKTKSGKVELGKVDGGDKNSIVTSSGKVVIDKIGNGTITTKRGSVVVKSVKNMQIETNTGKIAVEEALEALKVTTKRGKVTLGGDGMTMNNINVFSRIGRVYILSASGNVKIETISSNIEFTNKDSENINIISGGKLTATGLTGKVSIEALKNADLTFTKITDATNIKAGEKCKELIVKALDNTAKDTRFAIEAKNATRYEENDVGSGVFSTIEKGERLSNKIDSSYPAIVIEAKSSEVSIYFKASPEQN